MDVVIPHAENIITVAIGLGLIISLIFSETMGLAAGGMVVPGYIALNLRDPMRVVMTLLIGIITYLIVKLLSNFMILFGRRRTVVIVLVGFLLGALFKSRIMTFDLGGDSIDLAAIGFIIPGLVAMWIDRQGLVETTATLIASGVLVKIILILIYGAEMFQWL